MALQDSVKLLLLLVVALRTAVFNVDTTEPVILQLDPGYGSVHQVALQYYNDSAVRVLVKTSSNASENEHLITQCFITGPSSCKIHHPPSTKRGNISTELHIKFDGYVYYGSNDIEVTVNNIEETVNNIEERTKDGDEDSLQLTLITADFNNDGLMDVVKGEPAFREYRNFENGQVTVSIKKMQDGFDEIIINGYGYFGARFGAAVSCIGDINLDGFQDLAVGAPGEDGGRGAIYIYHGSASGIKHTYSQRIAAADLSYRDDEIRGFGASISEAVDIDRNHYGDLAVGADVSSNVVLLRSRPVLRLEKSFEPMVIRTYINDTFLEVPFCEKYTGKYVPFPIVVRLKLESFIYYVQKKTISSIPTGVLFNVTYLFPMDYKLCSKIKVPLKDLPKDSDGVLLPAVLRLESELESPIQAGVSSSSCPIFDPAETRMTQATIYIQCDDHGDCSGGIRKGWPVIGEKEILTTEGEGRAHKSDIPLILYVGGGLLAFAVVITALCFLYRKKNKKPKPPEVLMPPYHPRITKAPSQMSESLYDVPVLEQEYDDIM